MTDIERIADIVQRVARRLKVDPNAINRGERDVAQERYIAIYVAKESGIDAATIMRYFEVSDATVYTGIKAVRERLETEVILRAALHNLIRGLGTDGLPEKVITTDAPPRSPEAAMDEKQSRPAEPNEPKTEKFPTGSVRPNGRKDGQGALPAEALESGTSSPVDPRQDPAGIEDKSVARALPSTQRDRGGDEAGEVNASRPSTANAAEEDEPDKGPSIPVASWPRPFAPAEPTRPVELPTGSRGGYGRGLNGTDKSYIRKKLEELRLLKQKRTKSWDDAPLVHIRDRGRVVEVELETGERLVMLGPIASGSLQACLNRSAARIVQAISDGRFRIEEK